MLRNSFILLSILLLVSCSSNPMSSENNLPEAIITIQPNLNIDDSGFYHLKVERTYVQTLHKISLTTNCIDKSYRVEWEANATWLLSHYDFEFSVPVINEVSYTDDGVTHTMFAPVVEMVGDTVTVVAMLSESIYGGILTSDTTNIILE